VTPRLGHGQFFGVRDSAHELRDIGGFAISIKSAHPSIAVERHTHDDAHFILLLDGHYLSTARGAGHLHAEPALIFNPPGTTHQDTFPDRAGRFVGISLAAARFEATREIGEPIEVAERIWDPDTLQIAHAIAQLAIRDGDGDGEHERERLAIENACFELVASFVKALRDERGTGKGGGCGRPPRWVWHAREQLHDRAHEVARATGPEVGRDDLISGTSSGRRAEGAHANGDAVLSIASVARDVGVHPVHLARAFRRFFGCTPAAYVRRVRVERAALMVRSTPMALAEIAAMCGFVDQSHMSRAFVRDIGGTPAAYRRQHVRARGSDA
jgi:AraC family transcriptional regulator